jgi:hypothetical protein
MRSMGGANDHRCYHRWSKNGFCTAPGCGVPRPKEQKDLLPYELMNRDRIVKRGETSESKPEPA